MFQLRLSEKKVEIGSHYDFFPLRDNYFLEQIKLFARLMVLLNSESPACIYHYNLNGFTWEPNEVMSMWST
jgi:hypothetical protein